MALAGESPGQFRQIASLAHQDPALIKPPPASSLDLSGGGCDLCLLLIRQRSVLAPTEVQIAQRGSGVAEHILIHAMVVNG